MALECVRCGNHFHSSYRFLAARSREKGQMKFPLIPKIHPLEEILFLMEHQAKFSQWVLNPMVESCSLDEDFIGHAAYITRHVSPRLMALRTFNRYLTQIMLAWRSWSPAVASLYKTIHIYIYTSPLYWCFLQTTASQLEFGGHRKISCQMFWFSHFARKTPLERKKAFGLEKTVPEHFLRSKWQKTTFS